MGNNHSLGNRSGIQGANGFPLYFMPLPLGSSNLYAVQNTCIHENHIEISVFNTSAWILFFILFLTIPCFSFVPFCFNICRDNFDFCLDCRERLN